MPLGILMFNTTLHKLWLIGEIAVVKCFAAEYVLGEDTADDVAKGRVLEVLLGNPMASAHMVLFGQQRILFVVQVDL